MSGESKVKLKSGQDEMVEVDEVKLKSGQDEMVEVDEAAPSESVTIKNVLEDTELPNIPAKPLAKVLEYCQYHVELTKRSAEGEIVPDDEVKQWDAEFVNVPADDLMELLSAADSLNLGDLNIKNLRELACQAMADMITSKSTAEIRETFHIKNDFTPEEEEKLRECDQWAFESLEFEMI